MTDWPNEESEIPFARTIAIFYKCKSAVLGGKHT
jgi:hypothetical protein